MLTSGIEPGVIPIVGAAIGVLIAFLFHVREHAVLSHVTAMIVGVLMIIAAHNSGAITTAQGYIDHGRSAIAAH